MSSGRGPGELHGSEIPSVAWVDQGGMLTVSILPPTQTGTGCEELAVEAVKRT